MSFYINGICDILISHERGEQTLIKNACVLKVETDTQTMYYADSRYVDMPYPKVEYTITIEHTEDTTILDIPASKEPNNTLHQASVLELLHEIENKQKGAQDESLRSAPHKLSSD